MGEGTNSPILLSLLFWVVASIALVVVGLLLRRSGKLASRGAALGWAVLCIMPLFAAGAVMFTRHVAGQATGETRSGENRTPIH